MIKKYMDKQKTSFKMEVFFYIFTVELYLISFKNNNLYI